MYMQNVSKASPLSDLSPAEQGFYERFRDAYESYGACAWELERVNYELKKAANPSDLAKLEQARTAVDAKLGAELAKIQVLVAEAAKTLGEPKKFGQDFIGANGLANAIQQRIERDVLKDLDNNYPNLLKTAILNEFLAREKESRSSVYRKRFRTGFKNTAESLIEVQKNKNEKWREAVLLTHSERLGAQGAGLIREALRLRMARHGMK
jgi:hypothetical protein